MWPDVRYGVRMLFKYPTLSLAAVLTFGLGIGLTTTVFSVVNGALFKGLPFENADRLVAVLGTNPSRNQQRLVLTVQIGSARVAIVGVGCEDHREAAGDVNATGIAILVGWRIVGETRVGIRLQAITQLTQVTQVGLDLAQLNVIEPVGRFLAVARNERHGGATVKQLDRCLHLFVLSLYFLRNLRDDFLHGVRGASLTLAKT